MFQPFQYRKCLEIQIALNPRSIVIYSPSSPHLYWMVFTSVNLDEHRSPFSPLSPRLTATRAMLCRIIIPETRLTVWQGLEGCFTFCRWYIGSKTNWYICIIGLNFFFDFIRYPTFVLTKRMGKYLLYITNIYIGC